MRRWRSHESVVAAPTVAGKAAAPSAVLEKRRQWGFAAFPVAGAAAWMDSYAVAVHCLASVDAAVAAVDDDDDVVVVAAAFAAAAAFEHSSSTLFGIVVAVSTG